MNAQEFVEQNKILEIRTGSYLYGTAVPGVSDEDFSGIFLPPTEYILGFKRVEEVDLSIQDKQENGKNSEKAVDRKFYEFRRFIKLALENNPNILEHLFVDNKNLIFFNGVGARLLALRHKFVNQGLKQKFVGYAISQKHKMVIRKDTYFDLVNGLEYLKPYDGGKVLATLPENSPFKTRYDKNHNVVFLEIGDINLQVSHTINRAIKILEERLSKVGNRKDLLTKYGVDTKFGSHLIRLLLEAEELLETGELVFPLKKADFLLDIRNGKYTAEQILEISAELEHKIETTKGVVPMKPDYDAIQKFTMNELYNHVDKEFKGEVSERSMVEVLKTSVP